MSGAGRSRWVPLVAVVALVGSVVWMLVQGQGMAAWGSVARSGFPGGHGSMMGGGAWGAGSMMGGTSWGGSGTIGSPVQDLGQARAAAEQFAGGLGPDLGVGEVMQFDNQYYAEIVGADGELATEVLVDPVSGAVQIEYGPARMWNTRYGMMATGAGSNESVTAVEAEEIARRWLTDRGDLTAGEAEELPGYYTLHTLKDGEVEGMLSVNGTTGEVWYHSWHGDYVDMTEAR